MILIPGFLSFAKLVMISSAPAKICRGCQIRVIQCCLIQSNPFCILSSSFLCRTQLNQLFFLFFMLISTSLLFHRTSINYLLINLAVADMTLAIFFAPRYIFIHTFTHPDGMTGKVLCLLVTGGNLAWVGSGASVFTLVAIAIERYNAVIHPLGSKLELTNRKLKVRLKFLSAVEKPKYQASTINASTPMRPS